MKKNPLDIAILICLIIIIILLIILVWPIKEDSVEKKNSQDVSEEEVLQDESSKTESVSSEEDVSKTLFTDTSAASSEEEVVSYVEEVSQEVENLTYSSTSSSVKEKLEDTFITLTDFIFYGGTIKGVTFDELTDAAKEKVLTLYEKMDTTIESYFPNYKENIKNTAKKSYTTTVDKAKELKDKIVEGYKEKVGEDAYNNVVSGFEEDKNNLKDSFEPYVEKGKEVGTQAIEKGKEVLGNVGSNLDQWYQNFKESRE